MKKILLSIAVIGSFLFYSIHEQQEAKEAVNVVQNTRDKETLNQQARVTPTSSAGTPPTTSSNTTYIDGMYTGSVEDVFYGDVQVQATIVSGKITDITFLQYPNDRPTSTQINEAMIPILQQEAIKSQDADVDIVSGATDSSEGFKRSLANALKQAS